MNQLRVINRYHQQKARMATPKMNRDWQQVRDRIKAAWPNADFDDKRMAKARGGLRQMVDLVHERTELPRAQIRRRIAMMV